jgi:antitoxin (DNA-binding transcriptional repressor) of toxin-antitoxin stability system
MAVKVSGFRKHLFRLLDQAARGEPVDIDYNGRILRVLAAAPISTKRSRMQRRDDILRVPPEEIVESVVNMDEWEDKQREIEQSP